MTAVTVYREDSCESKNAENKETLYSLTLIMHICSVSDCEWFSSNGHINADMMTTGYTTETYGNECCELYQTDLIFLTLSLSPSNTSTREQPSRQSFKWTRSMRK